MNDLPTCFILTDWQVDVTSNELRQGNQVVKLESKMMAVLYYLARHHGEPVTREVLEQEVWGDTIVGYDALTGCIAKLRKMLGDDPRNPRYIETISKKGYRLIGEISGLTETTPKPEVSSGPKQDQPLRLHGKWKITGMLIAICVAIVISLMLSNSRNGTYSNRAPAAGSTDVPSIVVLPFNNINNEPGHDYFSQGITADITTALAKLSGLFVISPSSARGYQQTPQDITQVAGTLGVRYVVEGSVRRNKDRLRVNVHLVDALSDVYLWSEKYDRELQNLFVVQDDITANIVSALSVTLTKEEKRRTARRYTTDILAYDDFLRGQESYGHYTEKDNLLARDYYQQATTRDAGFARAWSATALTHVAEHRYGWGQPLPGRLDLALKLAQKAHALDRELPQVNWALAYVHLFRQEYRQAADIITRLIATTPNYANSYITLAVCKMNFGKPDEALLLVQKAMLLNPVYPASYSSMLGQIHFMSANYELAVSPLRKALEGNINLLTPHVFLIASLAKLKQTEDASWAYAQLKTIAPKFGIHDITGMLPMHDTSTIETLKTLLHEVVKE